MRRVRWLCTMILAAAGFAGAPLPVGAVSGGIIGQSGRQNAICSTTCHSGGVAPAVAFEAPAGTQMAAGAIATFRFRIASGRRNRQTAAGFNVAASGGIIGVVDAEGTHKIFEDLQEITHTQPRGNDENGEAVFEFSWQAPNVPGTYTLFGAGNSVNLDGGSGGDNAAAATLDVDVIGASTDTPLPTATPTPTPTATPSEEPTVTPTTPPTVTATASATPGNGDACTGDCDGSGEVTVDEIVRGVNIALGNRPVEDCLAFDRSGDGQVTVDEIVDAIGNALNGCL